MRKLTIIRLSRIALLVVIMTSASCKDWLTVEPENNLIKEKFWTKTADVEGALAASYNALRAASLKSLIFGELRADLVDFPGSSFTDYAKIAASDISPTNPVVTWKEYYAAINLANTLMYYDKEVFKKDKTFTQKMMDGVDAEALFIRSYAYFYLLRLWKDVPLVLEPSISDTSNLYIGKSTEAEIVNQIIADLLKAKDMAYTNEFRGSDYWYGRANKYSIMALLADVYLWNEQYEKCIEYCDLITSSGYYGLESYSTAFKIYYPGNSEVESIMELQYDDNLDNQNNPIYDNLVPVNGRPQCELNMINVALIMAKEDDRNYDGAGALWKTIGKDALGLISRSSTERDANWILYRYAEILFMKAEAQIELGINFEDVNAVIRESLIRASMPYEETYDQDLLRKNLLDERGREFMFEGRRWFDLLRASKRRTTPGGPTFANKQIIINMILSGADIKQQAILKTKVYDTMSYYLPIAEHEILYNQKLVQNPYYDR
jgi:hypothetical protein